MTGAAVEIPGTARIRITPIDSSLSQDVKDEFLGGVSGPYSSGSEYNPHDESIDDDELDESFFDRDSQISGEDSVAITTPRGLRRRRTLTYKKDGHHAHCIKCGEKGPTDAALPCKETKRRKKDVEAETKGPLLLCITCAAVAHEGCLPQGQTKKKYFRTCIRGDKTTEELQCSYCTPKNYKQGPCYPVCSGCKKPRTIRNLSIARSEDTPVEINEDQEEDDNILFRCQRCTRGFHYDCLPPFPDEEERLSHISSEKRLRARQLICQRKWQCPECVSYDRRMHSIITWRPVDKSVERADMIFENDDLKPREFLVRWQNTSYRHLSWVPEDWVQKIAPARWRKFCEVQLRQGYRPVEEIVPKQWLMIDRILEARNAEDEVLDASAGIEEVASIYATFQGLDYDDGK